MKRLIRDESGITLVELIVASAIALVVLGAVSNSFVSGLRAGTNTDARLTAQENLRTALDRLEFEGRCAATAEILSSGAGVHLNIPSWCANARGDVSWCVGGGSLVRYAATSCTGTGQTLASNVSAGTFSCSAPDGMLPQVTVSLTVNASTEAGNASSASDTFALRNGTPTAGGVSGCS